jgi:tRNA modification GTPase
MFCPADTIVAIATPPGRGGLGVVRIAGPEAQRIAGELTGRPAGFPERHATFARVRSGTHAIDQVIVTAFAAPRSYTGQDTVEISAHGSPVLLRGIVEAAVAAGARLAEPGEFTLRAFLNGRMDLVQAEAVGDLIDAVTPLQARAAFDQLEGTLTHRIQQVDRALFDVIARLEASLDFPGEGYHFVEPSAAANELRVVGSRIGELLAAARRGRLIREGLHVVLAGRPNSGKSSVFNALAGAGRAIVTDVPGTTRDLVTETVDVAGVPVTLVDTAGVRESAADAIEAEGIARARAARAVAAVTLVVLDGSRPLTRDDLRLLEETAFAPRVVALNKIDLRAAWDPSTLSPPLVRISARTGAGLDALRAALLDAIGNGEPHRDVPAVTNLRHLDLITRAAAAVKRAHAAASMGMSEEFVLADAHEARALLEEVTGARTPDDVLGEIFSRFCIGK